VKKETYRNLILRWIIFTLLLIGHIQASFSNISVSPKYASNFSEQQFFNDSASFPSLIQISQKSGNKIFSIPKSNDIEINSEYSLSSRKLIFSELLIINHLFYLPLQNLLTVKKTTDA